MTFMGDADREADPDSVRTLAQKCRTRRQRKERRRRRVTRATRAARSGRPLRAFLTERKYSENGERTPEGEDSKREREGECGQKASFSRWLRSRRDEESQNEVRSGNSEAKKRPFRDGAPAGPLLLEEAAATSLGIWRKLSSTEPVAGALSRCTNGGSFYMPAII